MDNNTQNASGIIELQFNMIRQRLEEGLADLHTEEEKNNMLNSELREFFMHVGKPLTKKPNAEYGHLPYIEDYNRIAEDISNDISVVYNELEYIGDAIAEAFNYSQNEKTKLKNRINALSSMVTDFNLISNEEDENVNHFKESFNNYNNIDFTVSSGSVANISTSEGVATLARENSTNCNNGSSIKLISGNGTPGNYHVAKRSEVTTEDGSQIISAKYQSDEGAHSDPEAIIDERPDTWFEYEMVNVSDEVKKITKGYDVEWTKGKEYNNKLRLRIVIDLGSIKEINWITVNPYLPEKSNGSLSVYSIKTSKDGIDFLSVKEGIATLESEIKSTPYTYSNDKIFIGSVYSSDKISTQGMFWFPLREARYVEVIMDQDQSYMETIGHTYYEKINTQLAQEQRIRIPSTDVPEEIVNGEQGKYYIDKNLYIIKGVDLLSGWRYCVGIKGINTYRYEFVEKSEVITKPFLSDRPIESIMLYSNEVIPEVFLQDLALANEWVQYYISIDDVNWHRISPAHHQPIGEQDGFPPKVYKINSKEVIEDSVEHPQYGYIYTNDDVQALRLKIILRRPIDIDNASHYTPILEDYSLRVSLKDDFLESRGLL